MASTTPKIEVANQVSAPLMKTLYEQLPPPNIDDDGAGNVIYGYAPQGVSETDTGWRLLKKVTSGTETKVLLPEGSFDFSFSWDDRATYTYSR